MTDTRLKEERSLHDTIQMIRDGKLDADPRFLDTDFAELLWIVNGCGSAQAKFDFVPDKIYGMDIRPACGPHDFGYHIGVTIEDKRREDRRLLNNILRLIQICSANKFMKWLRTKRAIKYYMAVDLLGGPAFWSGKE